MLILRTEEQFEVFNTWQSAQSLEPLVPTKSSQDKGNFPVRSRTKENYLEWKPAFSEI